MPPEWTVSFLKEKIQDEFEGVPWKGGWEARKERQTPLVWGELVCDTGGGRQ